MGGAFCVRFVNGFVNGMPLTPTVSASPGCCIRTARCARRGPTRLDLRSFSRARRGTEGGPGRPAPGRAEARVQGSPRAALNGRGSRRRWLGLAGSLAAGGRRPGPLPLRWGRTARAAAAAPFPRTCHRPGHPPSHPWVPAPAKTKRGRPPRAGRSCRRESSQPRARPTAAWPRPSASLRQTLDCELAWQDQHLPGGRARAAANRPVSHDLRCSQPMICSAADGVADHGSGCAAWPEASRRLRDARPGPWLSAARRSSVKRTSTRRSGGKCRRRCRGGLG